MFVHPRLGINGIALLIFTNLHHHHHLPLMFGDDVAGVVNAGAPGETEQPGGLGGEIFPADLTAEQSGRGGPDLLLWPWLLLSQEVDHLGVEPALYPVPPVREILNL